jgi:hypothetical protein
MPLALRRLGTRRVRCVAFCLGALIQVVGCGRDGDSPAAPSQLSELERATSGLTERIESASFVFHFQPGDGARAEVERSEAFHRWAVAYLGVTPPKKIDFYMFRSNQEMGAAFGAAFGGKAFPAEFAVATAYSWHNHECFHLYTCLVGNPPRIFAEGMPVAHEFDPYNNVWVSQWNRAEPYREPHLEIARQLKAAGLLYPMESILESDDFNRQVDGETVTIAYEQAGAWVSYLVATYGIDRMKQIVASIPYEASKDAIRSRFQAVYGVSVEEAEAAWLAWLDR